MQIEEKATYFEEMVRKSINPKKQADYISINEKGPQSSWVIMRSNEL